jgi:hypothetical protein
VQVWHALEGLPSPDKLHAAGHMQARQLKPATEALQALPCCGPLLQQTAVAKVVLQVGRLRQWQQQMPASARGGSSSSSAGVFAAGAAAASLSQQLSELQGQLLPEEYGASLQLALPEGPAALAWLMGSSSSQQQGAATSAAAVGSSGAVTTPGELRQLFAAEAAADDLGWGSAAAAAGGAAGDEYDVDIDSDDERKGRGKKVSKLGGRLCRQNDEYLRCCCCTLALHMARTAHACTYSECAADCAEDPICTWQCCVASFCCCARAVLNMSS